MDELIEHLQLNLGKDFGYEDDIVIEKLRDVMHELRSSRLDYAGMPHYLDWDFVQILVQFIGAHNYSLPCNVMLKYFQVDLPLKNYHKYHSD